MSLLEHLTPLVLTYNEEPNLARTLSRLTWARRVVVVDSGSTDATLAICAAHPNVEVVTRAFDDFAAQTNHGLAHVASEWVLSIDADYTVTDDLVREIAALAPTGFDAYRIRFKYCVHGRPLRSSILPPRTSLYRRAAACYEQDGHAHRVRIDGHVGALRSYLHHDDRKPLSRWLWAQDRYTHAEAIKLLATPAAGLSTNDRIRLKKVIAPWLVPLYVLVARGGVLDGWAGWYYALQRSLAETALAIRLIELQKLERRAADLTPNDEIRVTNQ